MGIEPTNVGTTIRCVNHFAISAIIIIHVNFFKRWLRTESNRRHKDFQSFALPTELLSHTKSISISTVELIYWDKNGGPDGTRTRDLLRDRQAF